MVRTRLLAPVAIRWIDQATHRVALTAVHGAQRHDSSLVDCASFETMRNLGIEHVFTFDKRFEQRGLEQL